MFANIPVLKNVREPKPTNLSHGKSFVKDSKIANPALSILIFLENGSACLYYFLSVTENGSFIFL